MRVVIPERFALIRTLRDDSESRTFLANDYVIDRESVLVRIIHRDRFRTDPQFVRELSWLVGMHHPRLATVFDAGLTKQQHLYYVRQYLPPSEIFTTNPMNVVKPLVSAVAFLGRHGFTHGAISPPNIFVHREKLKLSDAQPFCGRLNEKSIHFMAPEVILGKSTTHESDLYSVGAVLYRLITNRHLFEDPDFERLKSKYLSALPQLAPSLTFIPTSVFELILGLLQREPRRRVIAFERLISTIGAEWITAERAVFVGRSEELQESVKFLQASTTRLRVLLVEGAPGIGKSRFVAELRLNCAFHGLTFLTNHCSNLAALMDAVGKLVRTGPSTKRGQLPGETARPMQDDHIGVSTFSGKQYPIEKDVNDAIGLLRSCARASRAVFAIADVDRADAGIILLLQQLAFRASEMPFRLVLTRRPTMVEPEWINTIDTCIESDLSRLRLSELSENDSEKLVQFLDYEVKTQGKALYLAKGNPSLIEIYANSQKSSSGTSEQVVNITTSILSEIDAPTLVVLQALSVFLNPVGSRLVGMLCGRTFEEADERLKLAVYIGAARQNGQAFELSFPAVRSRLYSSLSKKKRSWFNRQAFLELRNGGEPDKKILAHYAFEAEMFAEAASLYRALAADSYKRQEYRATIDTYERLRKCLKNLSEDLTASEFLSLARCYDKGGHQRFSKRLYQELLSAPQVRADPQLLSTVYTRLAMSAKGSSIREREELLDRALTCLPKNSLYYSCYAAICSCFVRLSNLSRAREVFARMEQYVIADQQDSILLNSSRALLLFNTGDLRGAIEYYLKPHHIDADAAGVFNNVAFCFENIGDLKTALKYQLRAREAAICSGNAIAKLVSDNNLAAIRTKLGKAREAAYVLAQTLTDLKTIKTSNVVEKNGLLSTVSADTAVNALHRGDYQLAYLCMESLRLSLPSVFYMDRMLYEIIRCKVFIEIGLTKKVPELLSKLDASGLLNSDFLRVERALLEARLWEIPIKDRYDGLQHAFALSSKLGTGYQQCEVLIAQATLCLELDEIGATNCAREALKVARENDYRLLMVRALLVSGLATTDRLRDKQYFLFDALREASEMGLQELVAESAYHLGIHHLENGNTITAREYLIRSTTLTARLAEGVPLTARSKYLAKQWRRDALSALERCNELIPFNAAAAFNTDADKYFAAAYRFTTAVGAVNSVEGLLRAVETTLESAFGRCAMVTLQIGTNTFSMPVRVKAVPEFTQSLELLRSRAKGRVFFDSIDDKGKQPHAWIPLNSETCDGGIYVFCRPHESPFSEKEIELLVMMGTIANGALRRLETRNAQESEPQDISESHGIIGASKAIKNVYAQIQAAANNAATVLIEGESGTGKELVAKAIHAAGARAKGPFVAVDCGAIPEGLIEAELFGAKRGSYTGADTDRPGLFEAANRGTIFLDEISNTPMTLQAKLLRVIQEREVRRLGETKGRSIDVRLIVASNDDLEALSEAGKFRKDLLYRLKVLHIKVPPLRSRADDIPMLSHSFLQKLNASNKTRKYFAPDVVPLLSSEKFPGNVRELQNSIERAFFTTKGTMITGVPVNAPTTLASPATNDVQNWFKDIAAGREDFWSGVRNPYKRRDISREKIRALVDFGLRTTGGSYKDMVSQLRLKQSDYRRFMDFLRRNDCLLDFRPYRKATNASREN